MSPTPLAPVRYRVSIPAPSTHYLEIQATFPSECREAIDILLAVWTPGSYLVRDYSRHIEDVRCDRTLVKVAKNRWRVSGIDSAAVVVHYRVYCREMSVRTNWVEQDFALLNGAPAFLTLADSPVRPHVVVLELPASWQQAVTALPSEAAEPNHFVADSFDTLVDSPILLGCPIVREFTVSGRRHRLATIGDSGLFDSDKAAADLARVVEAQHALWGCVPYEDYVFLNVLTESGGGLEHANSTVLMGSRWATRSRAAYIGEFDREPGRHGWLGLASHEFLHVWNGKRLRPRALGPFDYERENYTRELWFAEGVTNYYDDLILARCGLMSPVEFFGSLSRQIERLQSAPGRFVRSVEASSFDAWIREYRPDENSANATVSYYTKGAVVAFLLDAEIRRSSADARSLDDLLRLAYERYSGSAGYSGEQLRETISEVAGQPLDDWLSHALSSTGELQYGHALAWFGLTFEQPCEQSEAGWTGLSTRNEGGRLLVSQIVRDCPGAEAGINVDDEIIAADGIRVRAEQWQKRLEDYRAGETIRLLTARRDQIRYVSLTLARKPCRSWQLYPDPNASSEQLARLRKWLRI